MLQVGPLLISVIAVIDRQFKGEIAGTMDKLTSELTHTLLTIYPDRLLARALQAQVEAVNVDRENSNKVKQEEGALSVARIKAQTANTQADADAYRIIAAAKAQAQKLRIEAEAQAQVTRLAAEADAEAIRIKAKADAGVVDQFAREMELRRVEVSRVQAYGNKAIFVPAEGPGAQLGNAMALGMAASMGAQATK